MPTRKRALIASAATLTLGFILAIPAADAQERKSIRWMTSSTDSYGYQVAASMTKIVEEALGKEYTVTVHPFPSTTAAMKSAMNGEGEIGYTADVGMTQLYASEGGFKDFKASKGMLVHAWYAYPMESFMAVAAEKVGEYKCLSDFNNKPVFYTPAGFMNWLNFQRINKALGYGFKHVQIDPKTQSDALKAGTITGAVAYTTAGRSLASYWKETEVRMDVKVVNPCPNEIAKLKAAGLTVAEIDPKNAFSKDIGVGKILGVPILFGYNVRPDMAEDTVYKMLTAFYNNRDKLASTDPGFAPMAKDFVGMQVAGINANPDIPVHAGLAKFLKEHKAWNDKWKVATGAS
jgi:TRAP-type uncharacterized transport system substrate-binding protein